MLTTEPARSGIERWNKIRVTFGFVLAVAVIIWLPIRAETFERLGFQQLPREIRQHAMEVRKSCKELVGENRTFDDMQGIQIVDLKGDGSRDIIVDNEGLCGSHMAGANCSNRGCDVRIYKEISRGAWRKIFEEHLYAKHFAIDWNTMRTEDEDGTRRVSRAFSKEGLAHALARINIRYKTLAKMAPRK